MLITELSELIAIPSVGGSAGEVAIQHHLAERLDDLGLAVDLWPIDLHRVRAAAGYPGEEVARDAAWGLVASNRPDDEPALILQGHVDVVPVGDLNAWSSDPFVATPSGDSVVGRGACDMKAGVAAILAAATAAQTAGQPVPTFAVHFVIGEEDGGLGAFATLQRGHRGRCCIIPEPTNLHVITANAGALTFRIEVPGLAAHGSTRYAGASAIDSYLPIHQALADLETRRNAIVEPSMSDFPIPYPLSVGRLRAGEWSSTVPDLAVVEGRFGLRIGEDPATAQREFEEAVLTASTSVAFLRDHPPVVSWPGGQFAGGRLPAGHRLADRVAALHEQVTGSPPPPPHGVPYGSDLRLYAQAGIPTLHYGPGDVSQAHTPNESVPIDQLLTTAEVLTRAVLQADQVATG